MNDKRGGPDRRALHDLAIGQHGYFTWSQAQACGYSSALITHHASSGGFERMRRGVYRFADIPRFEREAELTAWLAAGPRDDSVLSHETALELLGLSDMVPSRIHLTVPRSRRGYRGGLDVQVHTTSRPLRPDERTTWRGLSLTSPARTIVDAADAGTQPEQIAKAVQAAVGRAITTPQRLLRQADERSARVSELVRRFLPE